MMMALVVVAIAGLVGCSKPDEIQISTNNLWFGLEAGEQTLEIKANCEWTVTKNDEVDWYTISTMSGKKDATLTITVKALENGDYRGSSFVIMSPGGHVHRTIFISQNKLDFDGMINKVFGVMSVEHWNTDYYGQMIEDSYKHREYDPYDTTTGYWFYFLEDGKGVQRDHHRDTVVYYAFTYEYNPIEQILHIAFETVTDAPESYDPQLLTASDSLCRIFHEYKPNWWELFDMRKVSTIIPGEKSFIKNVATKKRKGQNGIFDMD